MKGEAVPGPFDLFDLLASSFMFRYFVLPGRLFCLDVGQEWLAVLREVTFFPLLSISGFSSFNMLK